MLRLGRIVGPHGLRGALRMRPDNPDSDALKKGARVFLQSTGDSHEYRVADITRINATTLKLTLESVADANMAEALKGAIVSLATEDVPAAKSGEFYYYEAIGCDVFLTDGSNIGKIEEVFSNGAHEIWVVRDGEREFLIPVIEDCVKAMDFRARRVTIEPIPGLLD